MAIDIKEFLKANGASEEDLKALTEGPHSKSLASAFEKLQAQAEKAEADRVAALASAAKVKEEYDNWFQNTAIPERQQIENELVAARANEAKAREALKVAQEKGLFNAAKDLGYEEKDLKNPASNPAPGSFDEKKYFTRDEILAIAQQEGDAIALAQDIAAEHAALFPGQRLNFRELRKEAVSQRKSVEQLWMEKYGVQAARDKKLADERAAEQAKWKAEGAKEKETELVSKYGNPDTRPLSPSVSPFAKRPSSGRDKMPWEQQGDRSEQRVMEATKKVVAQLTN